MASIINPSPQIDRGPYVYQASGQSYTAVTKSMTVTSGESPKFAQLWIIDTSDAVDSRLTEPANHNLSHTAVSLMTSLDTMLRTCNPFVQSYMSMGEKMRSEQQLALSEGRTASTVTMRMLYDTAKDSRRYNLPSASEIAVVYVGDSAGNPIGTFEFAVHSRTSDAYSFDRLKTSSPFLDPLAYPLLFPRGCYGWHPHLHTNPSDGAKPNKITQNQFIKQRIAFRPDSATNFSLLHSSGSLFHAYVCDSYMRLEAARLDYLYHNQSKLRIESYRILTDHVNTGDAGRVGRKIILPSTFIGSPRHMYEYFQDCMAIFRQKGKPDLFITVTCNPKWVEIESSKCSTKERPDLITRVFKLKLNSILEDIVNDEIFGKVVAWCYTIEYQKRGLPHAHMLFTLHESDKVRNPDIIDRYIRAEIPDPNSTDPKEKDLHNIIKSFMIHGPCGPSFGQAKCLNEAGICTKGYPKPFREKTSLNSDTGLPFYRRRNNNITIRLGHSPETFVEVDNRFVVPFNPYLSLKYNCHINVEDCCSIKSVKYITKYICKGHDAATIELEYNEIKEFRDSRYVSAPEAVWRLLNFQIHEKSHTVIKLSVHLPGEHTVMYEEGNEGDVVNSKKAQRSTLTAYFEMNRNESFPRDLHYYEFPTHFTWNVSSKTWKPRQRRGDGVVARMYTVSPNDKEKYYLRLNLLYTVGSTSFEDLRTVNGEIYSTFEAAAVARGLLETDETWRQCLQEAAMTQMPRQLRQLFVILIVFNTIADVSGLFEDFWQEMSDFNPSRHRHLSESELEFEIAKHRSLILQDLESQLTMHGLSLSSFHLPEPDPNFDELITFDEVEAQEEATSLMNLLNTDQRRLYDDVLSTLSRNDQNAKAIFLDGPGGTGKTFLYRALINRLIAERKSVVVAATTGLAAILLEGGRTVHSTFGIPLEVSSDTISLIKHRTKKAQKLLQADLIIIDEASMLSCNILSVIDRLLRDLTNNNHPFGGKCFFMGGDFRQILPIVEHGGRLECVEACLKRHALWPVFEKHSLTVNMRAEDEEIEFKEFLMSVGDGRLGSGIEIPPDLICPDLESLIFFVFGDLSGNLHQSAILAPTNALCAHVNDLIVSKLGGEAVELLSIDKVVGDTPEETATLATAFPTEFLNSKTPNGLPPHLLRLKKRAVVILLRNLNPDQGLCNGTRLQVEEIGSSILTLTIRNGPKAGRTVMLPRITLISEDKALPCKVSRYQFPVRLAHAMTINKSQGQTLNRVGLYLPRPVFSHGQLYVAFSRVRRRSDIKVCVCGENKTLNVVYEEVLDV